MDGALPDRDRVPIWLSQPLPARRRHHYLRLLVDVAADRHDGGGYTVQKSRGAPSTRWVCTRRYATMGPTHSVVVAAPPCLAAPPRPDSRCTHGEPTQSVQQTCLQAYLLFLVIKHAILRRKDSFRIGLWLTPFLFFIAVMFNVRCGSPLTSAWLLRAVHLWLHLPILCRRDAFPADLLRPGQGGAGRQELSHERRGKVGLERLQWRCGHAGGSRAVPWHLDLDADTDALILAAPMQLAMAYFWGYLRRRVLREMDREQHEGEQQQEHNSEGSSSKKARKKGKEGAKDGGKEGAQSVPLPAQHRETNGSSGASSSAGVTENGHTNDSALTVKPLAEPPAGSLEAAAITPARRGRGKKMMEGLMANKTFRAVTTASGSSDRDPHGGHSVQALLSPLPVIRRSGVTS